ncbi:MAG: hypothetical protein IJ528_06995 [Bacteroidaceae bacterium]|nr:hypothetical protein [Bacteroidaceae bacterium]
MTTKYAIKFAQIYSAIFSPFYAPIWAFLWLFFFSYLRLWPWGYKAFILVVVAVFTILLPRLGVEVFRRINKWSRWQLSHREHRHMPYFITIASYASCVFIFMQTGMALFMRGIVLAMLITGLICALVNAWWKVSTHMAGMGGLFGTIIAFSYLFYFNPLFPMCVMLLMSGVMGTSRMVLRQHSLAQVVVGFLIGTVCALMFILLVWI